MKRLLALFACCLSFAAAHACTITAPSTVDFGEVPIGSSPPDYEVVQTVEVNCPAGVNYRFYPRTDNIIITTGINVVFFRDDNVQMKSATTSTHIYGTGTGAPVAHTVKYRLTGSASAPSTPVTKIHDFTDPGFSYVTYTVRRLDNNATFNSNSTLYVGRTIGSCTISSAGSIDFGDMPRPRSADGVYEQTTSLSVNCTNTMAYKLYADHASAGNVWSAGSIRPYPSAPGTALLNLYLKPQASSTWTKFSSVGEYSTFTGTGAAQSYDLRLQLILPRTNPANGPFSLTIRPTVRF
jgi:spore coat protein U-like protein